MASIRQIRLAVIFGADLQVNWGCLGETANIDQILIRLHMGGAVVGGSPPRGGNIGPIQAPVRAQTSELDQSSLSLIYPLHRLRVAWLSMLGLAK